MPEKSPKISEIENQGISRLKQLEPQIDTSWYGKFALNLVRAFAGASYLVCLYAQRMFRATFVQFARNDDLDTHARENDLERKPATGSTGNVTIYGVVNTYIPLLAQLTANNGLVFSTNEEGYIVLKNFKTQLIEPEGDIAWLTVGDGHNITSGAQVNLTDFEPSSFNGSYRVIGVDGNRISVEIEAEDIATVGNISVNMTSVSVTCMSVGLDTNLTSGEQLTSSITGVGLIVVPAGGLTGGANRENDYYLLQRILKARSIIEGLFTTPQVELVALNVSGNTRSWVVEPEYNVTGGERGKAGYRPKAGEVVVYVVRDEDVSIIPSQTVLILTKKQIVEKGRMPCNTIEANIFVLSPKVEKVNITISGLSPDTPEMRRAVESEYLSNMNDWLSLNDGLTMKQIEQFILTAQDQSGNRLVNFQLISPNADIAGANGTLLVAGEITWQ